MAKLHNIEIGFLGPAAAPASMDHEPYLAAGFHDIGKSWNRQGYNFVPLVTADFCLRCSVDVLFLRPGAPGQVVGSGDLDSRLKSLFDSLRLPIRGEDVGNEIPSDDENPFFCLLEDDKLITEVKVTTDTLLLLPDHRESKENDVFLVITVRLNPTVPGPNQWVYA
jgi:hypothetical protein